MNTLRLSTFILLASLYFNSVQAMSVFSNSAVVTTPTNMATFDALISTLNTDLTNYTENGIIIAVPDTHSSFDGVHYGAGGNNDWVTISMVDNSPIFALDFLLGDGNSIDPFAAQQVDLIWEAFSGTTSVGSGLLSLTKGTTVGWEDTVGFTSLRVAAGILPITQFGDTQFFALDNLRVNAVPVPAAVWLFGTGLAGLLGLSRRNQSKVDIA